MSAEQEQEVAVSEQPVVESTESTPEEPKMVPLAAFEAERRKRQEAQAKNQVLEGFLARAKEETEEPEVKEDPKGLVENDKLQQVTATTKREILETLYKDMNPKAVQEIDQYLKLIFEKKPWLAASVDTAQNRWARAHEIVTDYKHLVEPTSTKAAVKSSAPTDGQRIVQNSQKPRSPVEIGKSAQPGGMDYLKSIQGKKEFREYRQKMLQGG